MRGVLMARRGRKRQLDAESLYWQLLLSGTGTVEACKAAGIGRKTGYRWRAEKGGGVQGGGQRPHARVLLAGGEGRRAPGAAGAGGPVGPVPVAAGAAADRDL